MLYRGSTGRFRVTEGHRNPTRRRVLRGGAAAILGGFAGCSGTTEGPESAHRSTRRTATPTPTGPSTTDSWTTFQFDPPNTGFAPENTGPTTRVNLQWTATLGNSVSATPVIADGVVFVASTEATLYALRWDTGTILAKVPADDLIVTSPAVADGQVYIGSRSGRVSAFPAAAFRGPDMILETWRHNARNGIFGAIKIAGETLYAGNQNGEVIALDKTAGIRTWLQPVGDYVDTAVAVSDGSVYVSSPVGWVLSLDAETGEREWRVAVDGGLTTAPTVVDGTVFVGSTEHPVFGLDHRVYALDARDGSQQWTVKPPTGTSTSTAVADGRVYIGTWGGKLHAFDTADGKRLFVTDFGAPVTTAPAVVSETVIAGAQNGRIAGLDPVDGSERFTFEAAAGIASPPAVVDGTVVFGTVDGTVYALAGR